jgi:hypothetical protein
VEEGEVDDTSGDDDDDEDVGVVVVVVEGALVLGNTVPSVNIISETELTEIFENILIEAELQIHEIL